MSMPTTPTASTISAPSILRKQARVDVWADDATGRMLTTRFAYCFYAAAGQRLSADPQPQPPWRRARRSPSHGAGGSITALPFEVHHGNIDALGFRVGGMAYTPDIDGVPDAQPAALRDLDLWIVDALRRTRHPSHWSLPQTLEWIARMKPKRAVITNMHIDLDFDTLAAGTSCHGRTGL